MSIRKVQPDNPQFLKLLQHLAEESYEMEGICWQSVLNKQSFLSKDIWGYFENDELKAFCFVDTTEGYKEYHFLKEHLPYSYIYYSEESKATSSLLKFLKETYPVIVVSWENCYEELHEAGFQHIECEFEEGIYIFSDEYAYISSNPSFIKEAYESYLKRKEIISIETEIKTSEELVKEIYGDSVYPNILTYKTKHNLFFFSGFTYFCSRDLRLEQNEKLRFITAYVNELDEGQIRKRLVGVLMVVQYKDYKALSYIDVHWNYRRIGIAKKLYQKLNEWLSEDDILVSTPLSIEGKQANLTAVRRKYVTKCLQFDTSDDYYRFRMNKQSISLSLS